ncbi:MAG: hypothetical protein PHU85_00060 [Phycisphaerae bacterium]|nr:hypothetical protein [Phycisphaerae bacterium]
MRSAGCTAVVYSALDACSRAAMGLSGPALAWILAGRWEKRTIYGALLRLRDQQRVRWDGTRWHRAKVWRVAR